MSQLPSGFAALPYVVLQDDRLTVKAKLAYAVLLMYAWQTQQCYPLVKTINRCLGTSKPTALKALAELEEADYITIERRPGQGSLYHLTTLTVDEDETVVKKFDRVVKKFDHMNRPNNRQSINGQAVDGGNGRTQGQLTFLQKFGRKRFATADQADAIRQLEKEVGLATLEKAMTWAAENNIRSISSIRTTARKIAVDEDNQRAKGKRRGLDQFRRVLYCPVCEVQLGGIEGCGCSSEEKRRWFHAVGDLPLLNVGEEELVEIKAAGGAYEWLETKPKPK